MLKHWIDTAPASTVEQTEEALEIAAAIVRALMNERDCSAEQAIETAQQMLIDELGRRYSRN